MAPLPTTPPYREVSLRLEPDLHEAVKALALRHRRNIQTEIAYALDCLVRLHAALPTDTRLRDRYGALLAELERLAAEAYPLPPPATSPV